MEYIRRIQLQILILPGASEEQAAADMVTLARRLGVSVTGLFNGREMWAHPNDMSSSVLFRYEQNKQLRREQ